MQLTLSRRGWRKKICAAACLVVLSVLLCLSFGACSPSAEMLAVFDDDSMIASGSDNSLSIMSTQSDFGTTFSYGAGEFTGVKTVRKDVVVGANPVINVDLSIEAGEFKLVFVAGNKVYTVLSSDNEGLLHTSLAAGKYDIKMVGRSAKVSLSINYEFSY